MLPAVQTASRESRNVHRDFKDGAGCVGVVGVGRSIFATPTRSLVPVLVSVRVERVVHSRSCKPHARVHVETRVDVPQCTGKVEDAAAS